MADLLHYSAHICKTAAAALIHQDKILLVQHKKLKIWLSPGGHIETGELAHQAAERECLEETGVKVKVVYPYPILIPTRCQYLPTPIATSLHWVSKSNYLARTHSRYPQKLHTTKIWPKGCEQHLGYLYLVAPVGLISITHDPRESTGIGWFSRAQLKTLDTHEDVKQELNLAFGVYNTLRL